MFYQGCIPEEEDLPSGSPFCTSCITPMAMTQALNKAKSPAAFRSKAARTQTHASQQYTPLLYVRVVVLAAEEST